MKRQDKPSAQANFPASVLSHLQIAYRQLEHAVGRQPWLLQGSVNVVAPKTPGGNATYTWTRKVRAKTVTVALSELQAEAFREAIATNRQVEEALLRLREVSQAALLESLPGVSRRRAETPQKGGATAVPKGA